MKITITEPISGATTSLEISDDISVETLKGLIEIDFHLPAGHQKLFLGSRLIDGSSQTTVKEVGINDKDLIIVVDSSGRVSPRRSGSMNLSNAVSQLMAFDFSTINVSGSSSQQPTAAQRRQQEDQQIENEADNIIRQYSLDPGIGESLELMNEGLVKMLREGNRAGVVECIRKEKQKRLEELTAQQARWRAVLADPNSEDSQKLLLEHIRQQQIEESYAHATEYLPETFGHVFMLYVKVEVNQVPLKAFVDSGAQATIMSKSCAERCGLMRLVDTRFRGIARGVGTSKIVGRIHLAQIKMGQTFFAASFTVLEDDKVDFLFGLDLLKRHQCVIDLETNTLKIDKEVLPFMSEREAQGDIFSVESSFESAPKTAEPPSSQLQEVFPVPPRSDQQTASFADREIMEQKIRRLIDIGFPRDFAVAALERTAGNVDDAAALLFQE